MKFFDSRGYLLVPGVRLLHARLHVHASALVLAALLLVTGFGQPSHALVSVGCYFGVILLHEVGHAAMARRLGYAAPEIWLSFMHGVCEHDAAETRCDDALIAWGGVLAQLAVAVPLMALAQLHVFDASPLGRIVVVGLGRASLLLVVFNLLPIRPLDGAKAWSLLPILLREWRARGVAKRTARDLLRRLK